MKFKLLAVIAFFVFGWPNQLAVFGEATVEQLSKQAADAAAKRNWTESQKFYRQILSIKEKEYGSIEDPRLVGSLNDIVRVTCVDGKCFDTMPYLKRLLQIRLKTPGPQSEDVAITYVLMAEAYEKGGKFREAQDYFNKALVVREKVYGKSSNEYLATKFNLVRVLEKTGDIKAAEQQHDECLKLLPLNGNRGVLARMIENHKVKALKSAAPTK